MSEGTGESRPAKRARVDEDTQSTDYGVHVTQEEVEKLREFQVLDEVKSDDEESNGEEQYKSSSDELAEEEIEKMLEADLPEGFKGVPKQKEKKYVKRQKIVLEEKGVNHFEVLPLDWMMVRHESGMPVYMHRGSRVCVLSKPYFLGQGNTRRHDIPISAIPCLAYRIALREEEKQKEIDRRIAEQIKNGTWVEPGQALENTEDQVSESSNSVEAAQIIAQKYGESSQNSITQDTQMPPTISDEMPQNKEIASETSDEMRQNSEITSAISDENSHDTEMTSTISDEISTKMEVLSQNSEESPQNPDSPCPGFSVDTSNRDLVAEINKMVNKASRFQDLQEKLKCPFKSRLMNLKEESNDSAESFEKDDNVRDNPVESAEDTSQPALEGGSASGARPVVLPGGLVMPPPRVETVNTSWKSQQLTAEQLNDYCKTLFKFKEVSVMHFKRWADRRKYTKARRTMQYPTLPEGTKLITIPAQEGGENGGGKAKRDWVMNMNGCSYLSVFHEYVRRALHKQPVYEFKQLENATAPYEATVHIGGMQYGVGRGSSKRQAKSQAARASIHILIPEMRDELPTSAADLKLSKDEQDFSFFDYVTIEDPRIQEFCGAAAEPSPHAILRTCLLRNFGAGDRHIHTEMKKLEFQKISLTMKVGKHSATVVCKNKKQAKQRASQAILQQLHPHITSWGSLLRLYGSRSMKSCKEKKLEEQQITLLQDKARQNEPNHAVLEKLRNEMAKLKERDNAVVPIGSLLMSAHLPTHSGSNLNNIDL